MPLSSVPGTRDPADLDRHDLAKSQPVAKLEQAAWWFVVVVVVVVVVVRRGSAESKRPAMEPVGPECNIRTGPSLRILWWTG